MTLRLLLVAVLISGTSCTTRKYMLSQPLDSGQKAVYEAPFDKVLKACYDVIAELSYNVKDERWDHREDKAWVINSSVGLASGGAGKYARIVILKSEKEQTVYVLVESKASSRASVQADLDDQKSFLARIEKRVTGK
jgi:hypothetical protein